MVLDFRLQDFPPLLYDLARFLALDPDRAQGIQLIAQCGQLTNKIVFHAARFHSNELLRQLDADLPSV
jgi:hypothetical protein